MSKSTFAHEVETDSIAGYDYGRTGVARGGEPSKRTSGDRGRAPGVIKGQ